MPRFHRGDTIPAHNVQCAVCGPDSPGRMLTALATVIDDDGTVSAPLTIGLEHQGAPHYAHGGTVMAILDDIMGYAGFVHEEAFVTAHMQTDFRQPVLLEHPYTCDARVTSIDGRKLHATSRLLDGETLLAEASALFVTVPVEHFRP